MTGDHSSVHPASPQAAVANAPDHGAGKDIVNGPTPVADSALEQFRSARTFRTRTVMQLQPYTRERQMYEAVLRRGGLKKGKHAIASAREITPDEEEDDPEEEMQQPSSPSVNPTQVMEDGERIVIGNTPPRTHRPPKPRPPQPIEQVDLTTFYAEYGRDAEEDESDDAQRLQKIVRTRLRDAKAERKKRKEAAKLKRSFKRFMREAGNDEETPRPPRVVDVSRSFFVLQSVTHRAVSC